MARQTIFNSLQQLRSHLNSIDASKTSRVFILFTGNKDENNVSWCPDCNDADPIIKKNLGHLSEDTDEFLTCFVGDRPTWKDPQNEFRLDSEFRLTCIPTLIQWKHNKVLKEEQCANESLVQMLFENDDQE